MTCNVKGKVIIYINGDQDIPSIKNDKFELNLLNQEGAYWNFEFKSLVAVNKGDAEDLCQKAFDLIAYYWNVPVSNLIMSDIHYTEVNTVTTLKQKSLSYVISQRLSQIVGAKHIGEKEFSDVNSFINDPIADDAEFNLLAKLYRNGLSAKPHEAYWSLYLVLLKCIVNEPDHDRQEINNWLINRSDLSESESEISDYNGKKTHLFVLLGDVLRHGTTINKGQNLNFHEKWVQKKDRFLELARLAIELKLSEVDKNYL